MPKARLDVLLVERGLAESRSAAQRLVMAGQVRVNGQLASRSAAAISPDSLIEIEQSPPFVSRGGEKLEVALQAFKLDASGKVCADVGASTGGFTDCLLQHGASRVYAIDVGQGILHWKLRQDPRVVVIERTNARFLEQLPEPVDWVTIDASFISLKILLPVVKSWLRASSLVIGNPAGTVIPLIKPQFEAGRHHVARGHGVIKDAALHRQVILDVLSFAQDTGYAVRGLIRSPILGPKGNTEFLAWMEYPGKNGEPIEPLADSLLIDE